MANVSQIKLPNGTAYDIKDTISGYITDAGVTKVKGNAETTYRTGQVNLTPANIGAVNKAGDTMTGKLTLPENLYTDNYTTGALDLKNSNIQGVNGIYTADLADNAQEGFHFYRDSTHVDSLYARNGELFFTPNRQLGTNGTPERIYSIPSYQVGTTDISMMPLIDRARANRLAFLPASQIIIEQTVDGGTTWTSAGVTDATKAALFSNLENGNVTLPRINGARSTLCGIRITFTAMKYNVPNGTAETKKYNYWNKNYVTGQERYSTLSRFWFWIGSNGDTMRIQAYRANGENPNNWDTIFSTDFGASGWSGSDWISFADNTFGGGTTQTYNYWNYRITFFSRLTDGKTEFTQTSEQSVYGIRGYGPNVWVTPNNLMNRDHIYSFNANQETTFPAKVTAPTFAGNLSGTADKAKKIIDANNNSSEITIEYSSSGISSASWFPAFSGYAIKPISAANVCSSIGALASSEKGAANGVVPLNASSKIDSTYLPSYVDDVLEYNGTANFPSTGEAGKIYVDTSTNKTYRWGGSSYTEISQGSIVSVSRSLTSGTKSATITVNGTGYDIYSTNNDDTKNTAGSTNTSSKIFLIGATSQAANPQTYSHDTAYVGTDGKLYSASKVVLVGGSNAASSVSITPSTTAVYSMTSAGSVTAGTKASFTRGTFSQGTLPTMTWAMDSTDTKKLNITFSQGTLPTHAADSFTANTPTAVTLPGRSSAINAWTGYSAATAAAQIFTGVTA